MIFLDHNSTTPVAPAVLEAMMPYFTTEFANPGSVSHAPGRLADEAVKRSIASIAASLGGVPDEIIVTSGATESNNLALFGVCYHPRQKRRKVVSVTTEHRAMLDPLKRLSKQGFDVVLVPVEFQTGLVDMQRLAEAVDSETALVSVMLANNEIGVVQPLAAIAGLCQKYGAVLHSDATQAVGNMPVHVDELGVDLLSFSAHKFYGPKGVGGLYVRQRGRRVRLQAQIVGGGQQHNLRSGTLNTPSIVGMGAALELSLQLNPVGGSEIGAWQRVQLLRDQLWAALSTRISGVSLNGPLLEGFPLGEPGSRLAGNLNCQFANCEGQSLMQLIPELAVSSGSACTSAEEGVSHVLIGIGLSEDAARSSLRFGIGRDNTPEEIVQVVDWLAEATEALRSLRSPNATK